MPVLQRAVEAAESNIPFRYSEYCRSNLGLFYIFDNRCSPSHQLIARLGMGLTYLMVILEIGLFAWMIFIWVADRREYRQWKGLQIIAGLEDEESIREAAMEYGIPLESIPLREQPMIEKR
jgi:hypothetical protein